MLNISWRNDSEYLAPIFSPYFSFLGRALDKLAILSAFELTLISTVSYRIVSYRVVAIRIASLHDVELS